MQANISFLNSKLDIKQFESKNEFKTQSSLSMIYILSTNEIIHSLKL